MKQLPPEVLVEIIKYLYYILAGCAGCGVGAFVFFHKGILKRLEQTDSDVKPVVTKIAVQEQRTDTHDARLHDHDKRISAIENWIKDNYKK